MQEVTVHHMEHVRAMPLLEMTLQQQALLSELLSGTQEAPQVTMSEPDIPGTSLQRDMFSAGIVSSAANNGGIAFQVPGSSIDLMLEVDKKMVEGANLFGDLEARAASLIGRDDVLSVPKPIALAGGASAVSVAALALLSASTSRRAIQVYHCCSYILSSYYII
jgi:hypothetical protein